MNKKIIVIAVLSALAAQAARAEQVIDSTTSSINPAITDIVAEGTNINAAGANGSQILIGNFIDSTADAATVVGNNNNVNGVDFMAFTTNSTIDAYQNSTLMGFGLTTAGVFHSFIGGDGITADGNRVVAIGSLIDITGAGFNNSIGAFNTINGDHNLQFGYLSEITGSSNAAFGSVAMHNFTGNQSTGIGYESLSNATGDDNFAGGSSAGRALNGNRDVVIGNFAGNNSTGDDNAFVGTYAGNNTSGSGNVSVGGYAGVSVSDSVTTAVGFGASTSGAGTGAPLISGSGNTSVGAYALTGNQQNTAIGYSAATDGTAVNSVALGANSYVDASETVSVGNRLTNLTRTLTGLKDGLVAASSTDAVTGNQLFTTNQNVTTAVNLATQAGADAATALSTANTANTTANNALSVANAAYTYADTLAAATLGSANAYTDAAIAALPSFNDSQLLKLDGTRAMTGNLDMGGNKVTNMADGTAATDGATVGQLNGLLHKTDVNGVSDVNVAGASIQMTSQGATSFAGMSVENNVGVSAVAVNMMTGASSQFTVASSGFNSQVNDGVTSSAIDQQAGSISIGVTNGLGNTHGLNVGTSQTTLSGGQHSTVMTLDDNGVTVAKMSDGSAVQIHNVADPTSALDAVNLQTLQAYAMSGGDPALQGQVDQNTADIDALKRETADIRKDIGHLKNELYAAVAGANALASITPGRGDSIGMAIGGAGNQAAVAFKATKRFAGGKTLSAGFSVNTRGGLGWGVSYSIPWNPTTVAWKK